MQVISEEAFLLWGIISLRTRNLMMVKAKSAKNRILAKKILEECKFDPKNLKKDAEIQFEGTNGCSKKGVGSEINKNFYSLTDPFTFEARDFEVSNGSTQIRSNLAKS